MVSRTTKNYKVIYLPNALAAELDKLIENDTDRAFRNKTDFLIFLARKEIEQLAQLERIKKTTSGLD